LKSKPSKYEHEVSSKQSSLDTYFIFGFSLDYSSAVKMEAIYEKSVDSI
jgi:hypothetical protein